MDELSLHRHLTLQNAAGGYEPEALSGTPQRSNVQETTRWRRRERGLYLAAWCGLAGSLTATVYAFLTGSMASVAAAVLLSGLASLAPEWIALRQTQRLLHVREDRRVSPIGGLDIRLIRDAVQEPAAGQWLEWYDSPAEGSKPTIH